MRQVTKQASNALKAHTKFTSGNTSVRVYEMNTPQGLKDVAVMALHGNEIAKFGNGLLTINDCGWTSVTTKERLNGILDTFNTGLGIRQEKGQWKLLQWIEHSDGGSWEVKANWNGTYNIKVKG